MVKKRQRYSEEVKKQVLGDIEKGMTQREAAKKNKVGYDSVPGWVKAAKAEGKIKTTSKKAPSKSSPKQTDHFAELQKEREHYYKLKEGLAAIGKILSDMGI